jgi:hypothetical protein
MGWGFVWLMFALKIPILALGCIVWWAIRQEPEPAGSGSGDDGGVKPRAPRHPRTPLPRLPRRGPHGDRALTPPPRIRVTVARSRTFER